MKRQKFSIILALVLLMAQAATLNAATHPVANSAQLSAALSTCASGDVIQLTANITHNTGISIIDKIVTISLNSFSLTVDCSDEYGLRVHNNGELRLTGWSASAKFNVKGRLGVSAVSGGKAAVSNATGTYGNGVYATGAGTTVVVLDKAISETAGVGVEASAGAFVSVEEAEGPRSGVYATGTGSKVSVRNTKSTGGSAQNYGAFGGDGAEVIVVGDATASISFGSGRMYGAYATGAGTKLSVGGNVTSTGNSDTYGAYAMYGAELTVSGNITASAGTFSAVGVFADGAGTKVTVGGNVTSTGATNSGTYGVRAWNGAEVSVAKDVTGSYCGLDADSGAEVSVTGDVTGGSYGVRATGANTKVTVDGTVSGTYYIRCGSITKTISDHEPTSTKSGYLEYTDGSAKVWVRIVIIPKTVTFTTISQTVAQGGAANYNITTSGMANGSPTCSTQWYSNAAGTTSTSAPAGISNIAYTISGNSTTKSIATGLTTPPGTYYFRETIDGVQSSNVATLIVTAKTVTFTTISQTVAQGGTANYNITTSGIPNGSPTCSTHWYSNAAGTTSTSAPANIANIDYTISGNSTTKSIMTFLTTHPGTYYFREEIDGVLSSNVATLVVTLAPPFIITQPVDVTVTQAETATFTVVATGTADLTFQWQIYMAYPSPGRWQNLPGGIHHTGQDTPTLSVHNPTSDGRYRCRVTNAAGYTDSNEARLTVSGIISVTGISFVPTTATAGTPLTLSGIISPLEATNRTIVWTVKDAGTTGATIAAGTNILNTTAAGVVVVRATIVNGISATSDYVQDNTITVAAGASVAVTGVTLSATTLSGTVGGSANLAATVQPANATDKTVTWSTSDAAVATVSSSGLVNYVGAGSATITATTQDGGKTATCAVTVTGGALVPTYALTVVGGTGDGNYQAGTIVPVTADAPAAGKEFDRWTTSAGGSFSNINQPSATFTMPANAVTVTATYRDLPPTPIYYTVAFNADGGAPAPASQTVAAGNKAAEPTPPTKNGHLFAGWYDGAYHWNFAADVVNSNLTLTARWDIDTGNDAIGQPTLKAWTVGGALYATGLTAGAPLSVYSLTGIQIYSGVALDAETQRIASLPARGVYIVTDGKTVVKVVN